MVLLIGILIFAHPALRLKYHNKFEATHRFMGWAAVGLVWALVRIYNQDPPSHQPYARNLDCHPQ